MTSSSELYQQYLKTRIPSRTEEVEGPKYINISYADAAKASQKNAMQYIRTTLERQSQTLQLTTEVLGALFDGDHFDEIKHLIDKQKASDLNGSLKNTIVSNIAKIHQASSSGNNDASNLIYKIQAMTGEDYRANLSEKMEFVDNTHILAGETYYDVQGKIQVPLHLFTEEYRHTHSDDIYGFTVDYKTAWHELSLEVKKANLEYALNNNYHLDNFRREFASNQGNNEIIKNILDNDNDKEWFAREIIKNNLIDNNNLELYNTALSIFNDTGVLTSIRYWFYELYLDIRNLLPATEEVTYANQYPMNIEHTVAGESHKYYNLLFAQEF